MASSSSPFPSVTPEPAEYDEDTRDNFKDMPEKARLWGAALTDAGNLSGRDSAMIRPDSMVVEELVNYVLKRLEDILFSSYFEGLIGIEPGNRSELWFYEDVYQVQETNKKLELVPFSKGDKLVSFFKLECDRLDSHAIVLKSKTDLKQLRLQLPDVHYVLQHTECMDLRGIINDVDQLIDDCEQSEMSKSKFEQEVRRIHGRLLQMLNSFHKLDAGHDAVNSAISHGSSRKYDEYPLSETDIDRFINQVIYELLRDVNVVRIVPLVGTGGIGNTVLALRVYTDEKMKSHFPFRCWFSVGRNLDLSTIVKAIALQYREMVDCRDVPSKRLLIVLDDVCEIDGENLESFRLLISNMPASGSCVLLSTHSLHLATRMSSVPAGHLTWWPEFHSQAPSKSEFVPSLGAVDSPVIQHELMAPESVVMTEPHRHSISGRKDEMTSNLPGHFGVVSEIVPASDTEPLSDMDEDLVSGPKNLTEDEMTLPPQTEELATHVPGNTITISDGKGRMQPILVKFGCGLFQKKRDQANRMLNVFVNQSVEAAVPKEAIGLGPINLTAVKSMKRNVQKIVRYVNDVTVSTVALTMKRNVQKIVRYVIPHRGRKDEMTSNLSGHFGVVSEIVPASDTEPMSDLDEPMSLSCSNLLILSLQGNFQLRDIPPSLFDSMNSLKFLNLSNTRIKSLPNTISKLRELQILILRDCERLSMLPSEIGSLVSLEVLDLRGTEIYNLPDEIVNLASLRYLEVFFYGSIDDREYASLPCNLISRNTISRLQALESLSIVVFPGDERWYRDVEYVIPEVSSLPKLSSLRFHFPQSQHVKEFLEKSMAWRDRRLTKFNFVVGYDVKRIISRVPEYVEFDYNQHDKCLRNVNVKEICPTTIQILARSDAFYLDHHLDIENLSDFGLSNIKGLKFCIISECPRIKTVVNNKDHTAAVFPSLENLNVNLLWNLTCIWEGIVPRGSLAELRILSVRTCPKLEFILTRSIIGFLTKLEELTVEDCRAVRSILLEDEIIGSSSVMLPSLKRLRLHDLPELVNIWENVGSSVEQISIFNCPKLKKMGMESSSKLKDTLIEIEAEKWWWDELQWDDIDMPSNLEDRLTIIS